MHVCAHAHAQLALAIAQHLLDRDMFVLIKQEVLQCSVKVHMRLQTQHALTYAALRTMQFALLKSLYKQIKKAFEVKIRTA